MAHLSSYGEVDERGGDADLGQVVGVGQLGGQEQLEIGIIVHLAARQPDEAPRALQKQAVNCCKSRWLVEQHTPSW